MWHFATSAGTGLAVAGLSATYYALARKNAELERASAARISDDGDQSRPAADKTFPAMTASQMLLKKELDTLSRDEGRHLGLNGFEGGQFHYPTITSEPIMQNQYSGMQLRNIVSRVETNFAIRSSIPQIHTTQPMEDSDLDVTPGPEGMDNDYIPLRWVEEEDGENDLHSPLEEDKIMLPENNSASQSIAKTFKSVIASHMKRSTSSPSEERLITVERKKSPIFYYKNPDFGKRLAAGRNPMQFPEMTISPGFNIKKELYGLGKSTEPNENGGSKYSDSTRFIFPPVLSESRFSVCDEEQELSVEEADSEEIRINEEKNLGIDNLAERDEIRDYNYRLQMQQISLGGGGLEDSGVFLNDSSDQYPPKQFMQQDEDPELADENSVDSLDQEEPMIGSEAGENVGDFEENDNNGSDDEEEMDSYYHGLRRRAEAKALRQEDKTGIESGDGDTWTPETEQETIQKLRIICITTDEESETSCEEIIYPKVVTAPSTSVLGRIPPNSWIIWPVRVYSEFAHNHPTAVLVFVGAVVLLTMLLGKIFITMGDWFEYVNDIDYNPDAVMEH